MLALFVFDIKLLIGKNEGFIQICQLIFSILSKLKSQENSDHSIEFDQEEREILQIFANVT